MSPILLVTHDLEECFDLGDEMLVLREGRIVQSGTAKELCSRSRRMWRWRGCWAFGTCSRRRSPRSIPGRNTSRLKTARFRTDGSYYPGPISAATDVWLCVSAEELRVIAARIGDESRAGAIDPRFRYGRKPMRLEFARDITVEMSRAEFREAEG